jgi:hypothetical protein
MTRINAACIAFALVVVGACAGEFEIGGEVPTTIADELAQGGVELIDEPRPEAVEVLGAAANESGRHGGREPQRWFCWAQDVTNEACRTGWPGRSELDAAYRAQLHCHRVCGGYCDVRCELW